MWKKNHCRRVERIRQLAQCTNQAQRATLAQRAKPSSTPSLAQREGQA